MTDEEADRIIDEEADRIIDEEADRIIDKLKYSKKELEFNDLMEYCKTLTAGAKINYFFGAPAAERLPRYYTELYNTPIITHDYITKLTS